MIRYFIQGFNGAFSPLFFIKPDGVDFAPEGLSGTGGGGRVT